MEAEFGAIQEKKGASKGEVRVPKGRLGSIYITVLPGDRPALT